MRSDCKLPKLWEEINWRIYIWWLETKYCSWHKRNYVDMQCVKCWRISHVEVKWIYKNWCKCNQLASIKDKHWFAHKWKHLENRFYNIYCWILRRCNWTAWERWKHLYYWKWIKCEWNNFEEFKDDMRESYKKHVEIYWEKNTSIDRINWNWNYSKSNCRRATCKEQSNNTKLTIKVEIDWKIYWSQDISNITWISCCAARDRLKKYKKWIIDKDKLFSKK